MFICEQCGNCCRHLDNSDLYKELDRGDGVCRYLKENKCSIYEKRPILCRIEESFDEFFSEIYTKEEYYKQNELACNRLRSL